MNDKNVQLVDELMQSIGQTDVWQDELANNPMIQQSEKELSAVMEKIRQYAPKELADQLSDTVSENIVAYEWPAILYGMRVVYAIEDVSRRPSDLSRFLMQRTGRATE